MRRSGLSPKASNRPPLPKAPSPPTRRLKRRRFIRLPAVDAAGNGNGEEHSDDEAVESVGGADALEEVQERLPRFRRQYKIQEVIKRRQVMLVQVVKEERGTKGAALTTYLSLAGRYSVLMPNTARGGGISRKITSAEDRMRLKEISQELEVPEGMGVILRTAGASRTKTEVKRDFEYLLRLWETVRDLTLKSTAPKLVYEEGSLTKRSIRDLYGKDIEEIIVSGEEGYKEAREFMRMLMPSHAKNVKQYKDTQPLFTRYGIESQLDAMFSPVVQLRSGGYIVINQAEALVAIDVNSGRATREHHIEDTALKTNCEAADEIARQLRLRDLAGLIVIDFIDMDEGRNNRTVERRLKEALKHDRARIQVGRISHFGLLEISRQRIRTSVLESSTEKCPVCGGSGHVRSVSSVALQLLRAVEEMLIKGATHNLIVRTRAEVALYVLNHKRAHLRALEERFRITITVSADPAVTGQQSYVIDRGEQVHTPRQHAILLPSSRRFRHRQTKPKRTSSQRMSKKKVPNSRQLSRRAKPLGKAGNVKAAANVGAGADAADGDAAASRVAMRKHSRTTPSPNMSSRTRTMTAARPTRATQNSNSRPRTALNPAKARPAKARTAAAGVAAAAAAATGSATVRGRHSRVTQPRSPRLSNLTSSRSTRASRSMLRRSSTTPPRRPKNRWRLQASRTLGDAVPLFVNRSLFPAKACRPRPQISHRRRRSSPVPETSRPPKRGWWGKRLLGDKS
jgi:Rne/Rng family ribonuclease